MLRRFVGFLLLALFVASAAGVVHDGGWGWWLALAVQLWFYLLAILGALLDRAGRKVPRLLWIPYYFCLSNLAAVLAVLTLAGGTRFEMWEPASDRGSRSGTLGEGRSHERVRRLVHAAARMAFPHVDPGRRAVIIGYHSIHPSAPYASATPAEFEQHLDWLQAHCKLVALDQSRPSRGGPSSGCLDLR